MFQFSEEEKNNYLERRRRDSHIKLGRRVDTTFLRIQKFSPGNFHITAETIKKERREQQHDDIIIKKKKKNETKSFKLIRSRRASSCV